MTSTLPARNLPKVSTATLIVQYQLAIASHGGRYTDAAPRQRRINRIVNLLSDRADADDAEALAWFAATNQR
jgi:hypothetical protein